VPPAALIVIALIFAHRGSTFVAAVWGTIAASMIIYALFPHSALTQSALRERGTQKRQNETERAFCLRIAAYWGIAALTCTGLFVLGALGRDVLPQDIADHGIFGAIFFFMLPLLGVTFALKGVGGIWRALRARSHGV